MNNFDDTPIDHPSKDGFGLDPFASTISDCIRELRNPVGSVVAIYGPWGSGKSSAINLVLHHLHSNCSKDINIIRFPVWMYRSEDVLTAGFFKELHAGLSLVSSKQKKAADTLKKLGAHVIGAKNLAGATVGLFAGSLGQKTTGFVFDTLENFIGQDETVEGLHKQLTNTLKKERKRFLVVIDDLDRLSPEEALVIFRLVKSVGHLPNIIYLLAYDRERTEKAVAKRFPSEGPHYLEKIVQAGFELPEPPQPLLNATMDRYLHDIVKDMPVFDPMEFSKLFYSIVVPELKTPRDVIRLANVLSVTVEPVKNEVFFPDFMSLETLRVFRPGVYRAIRSNKSKILDSSRFLRDDNQNEQTEEFSRLLLKSEAKDNHKRLKEALMFLFPQLQGVFTNNSFSGITYQWRRQRRVFLKEHFDTYFRFAMSPEVIPREKYEYLFDKRRTIEEIQEWFIESVEASQTNSGPKISYLLDDLAAHGETVPIPQAKKILSALFLVIDELFTALDKEGGLGLVDNRFHIYRLIRAFLHNRTTIEERSSILMPCLRETSLQWLSDFSRTAWLNYYPNDSDGALSPEEQALLTKKFARGLREITRHQIEEAATNGTLIDAAGLAYILFAWDVLKADDSDEVRHFTTDVIADDQKIVKLTQAFLAKSYVHNIDSTGSSSGYIHKAIIDGIDRFLDINSFRSRLESLENNSSLPKEEKNIIKKFLASWNIQDRERGI